MPEGQRNYGSGNQESKIIRERPMKFAICIFVIVGAVFGIYFKIAMDNAQRKDNCRQLL